LSHHRTGEFSQIAKHSPTGSRHVSALKRRPLLRDFRSIRIEALPAIIAVALLWLGIPQAAGAIVRLYCGGDAITSAPLAEPAGTRAVAAILDRTDERLGDPQARLSAGIARVFVAFAAGAGQRLDREELARAITDLVDGLTRAPANAVAWAALAHAQLALGDEEKARQAFRMSLLLASYEPRLALWRSEIGLELLDKLDDGERCLWSQQVRIAWDHSWDGSRAELLALARKPIFAMGLRAGLASDPRRLSNFEQVLREQR
jgi:hypothetical protein